MEHQMLSLADQVFDVIERDILNSTYERGTRLTETGLSEQLGVSRTPVREAIRRLCQEHLLEMTNHGVRVVGVSPEDIKDKQQVKLIFESCGSKERPDAIRQSVESLKAAGLNAVGYISEGTAHEFLTWRRSLYQMAQKLFK